MNGITKNEGQINQSLAVTDNEARSDLGTAGYT